MITVKKADEVVVAVVMRRGQVEVVSTQPHVKLVFVDYSDASGEEMIDGVQCAAELAEATVDPVLARKAMIAAQTDEIETEEEVEAA